MVGLAILIGSTNAVPGFYFNAAAPLAPLPWQPLEGR